jgi:beta-galactosidase
VIARYTRDYYAGEPAITLNRFGNGKAVYVGTIGDDALYEMLAGWLLEMANVRRMISAPGGVEVAERWQGSQRLLFVLNHTERPQEITLDRPYADLLDGAGSREGTVVVAPRDVLVLQEGKR